MLVEVLALGSAVALGSNLAFGRQNKSLRQKLRPGNSLQPKPASRSTAWTSQSDSEAHSKSRLNVGTNQGLFATAGSKNLYRGAKHSLLALKKVFAISMGGAQTRDQHLSRLAAQQGNQDFQLSAEKLDRKITLSMGLMGLAAVGALFYAPFLRLAGAGTLYLYIPVIQELTRNLRKGRITTELIDVVSWISFLISGYFLLATVVTFTALMNLKLIKRTEEHSHQQLIDSFHQKPHSIWVISDGAEVETPLASVRKDDVVVVNAGEMIPVDGAIVEGVATIDQHSLTGESQPVEKETGDKVFATTLVLSGRVLIKAERTGADTNAAKIEVILEQTLEYKESLRLRGKHIADGFIAPTLLLSSLTLPLLGPSSAMAILWSAFGYNMKVYGPISVLNFLHIMAKNGILIKDGRSLEMLREVDTVVFDKTGTLTVEQPKLGRLLPLGSFDETTLLTYAAAAEHRQSHPIAKAILSAAEQRGLDLPIIEDAAYEVGYGIQVALDGKQILVGSFRLMQQKEVRVSDQVQALKDKAEAKGNSLVFVAVDGELAGVLELEPCIRPEAKQTIDYLKAEGISVSIISGDHEEPTRRLAEELGVDTYYAETLPTRKAELISELRSTGKFVCYMGDGINDAIALKEANVSISLSGASTVATDTAQIILMDGDLDRIEALFEIAKAFEKNMESNFLNSMVPGVICLCGVFMLNMGLTGGLVVYFSSKLVGLMNCMMPLVKDELESDAAPAGVTDDEERRASLREPDRSAVPTSA